MEQIKILFFIVGTFFGVNQSNIIAEKTTVTVNPKEKTITILQENLVSIMQIESDSLNVYKELSTIVNAEQAWSSEFKDYVKKEKKFFISEDDKSLNSNLTLTYSTPSDLKVFGIDLNNDGKFSMTNFPKSNIKSSDGTLDERYWHFNADKPFTFTEEPLSDLPEKYNKLKKSLLSAYKSMKL